MQPKIYQTQENCGKSAGVNNSNFQKTFFYTDAFEVAAGSVMMQNNDKRGILAIGYYGKKFTDSERNVSIY